MDNGRYIIEVNGIKTLPLYCLMGKSLETVGPFGKGRVGVEFVEPEYDPPSYSANSETLNRLGSDADEANRAVKLWAKHVGEFMYFVQFKDDVDKSRIKALHNHTETISSLCDNRLQIDTTVLWERFDGLFSFSCVHSEYREDPERDLKYEHYAARLEKVHEPLANTNTPALRLIDRICKQIEIKKTLWATMPPIVIVKQNDSEPKPLSLFYSYSHRDEILRDQLQTHLSGLKRNEVITDWHDRKISAGREWEGQIDSHLRNSQIILLLISADFIASDYCYDIELKEAIRMHQNGVARVVPVILRACDWHSCLFGKLQALPKDGDAITSWKNIDEAFTDVAKGIRRIADELCSPKDRSQL